MGRDISISSLPGDAVSSLLFLSSIQLILRAEDIVIKKASESFSLKAPERETLPGVFKSQLPTLCHRIIPFQRVVRIMAGTDSEHR